MHAKLVQRAIGVLVALAIFTAAPGGSALASHRSAAQECQREINKESQEYSKARQRKLFKCGEKKFKRDKDATKCIKRVKSEKVRVDERACPPDVITGPPSENALGITACVTRAPGCPTPVDAASMASCIACSYKFEVDCLFRAVYNASTPECEMP
jgi:hypothetical protein